MWVRALACQLAPHTPQWKGCEKMTKKYMIDTYALYLSDFRLARNEDDEWKARHGMARLEELACLLYGFEFCDELPVLAREKLA